MEPIHLQVLACLALSEGFDSATALLDYLPPARAESLEALLNRTDPQTLQEQLKAFSARESFSGIAEIHPAWLLEALKKESPRVIGVILRHLPSKHVRYLLEHLPRHVVVKLPKLIEAFYVPTEILNLVRRRFERHFVPVRISHQPELIDFNHLYYLKMEEIDLLFHDLGMSELALSLVGSTRQVMKVILNRFGIKEAKEILSRIKRYQLQEKGFVKEAKYSVLETGGEVLGAERFLKELGLLSLVKAFDRSDISLFNILRQRLSPDCAYLFKRYLDRQVSRADTQTVAKRKIWILEHVRVLSEQGKIDSVWSKVSSQEAA
ncbi:MAG: hypothetical protein Q7T03_02525 [Deltaproteobacteria bacterium]|nr:hypothetical protein [Deltaproteobacteria bacterium]